MRESGECVCDEFGCRRSVLVENRNSGVEEVVAEVDATRRESGFLFLQLLRPKQLHGN